MSSAFIIPAPSWTYIGPGHAHNIDYVLAQHDNLGTGPKFIIVVLLTNQGITDTFLYWHGQDRTY